MSCDMENKDKIIINRIWAMPNRWTFQISPIADLLARYVGDGKGWIDPFSGMSTLAEFRNDLNPESPAQSHVDALEFIKQFNSTMFKGIIFDPPYSLRQMKECYDSIGRKMTGREVAEVYSDLRFAIQDKIIPGGVAISFGWNSIGMGKTHGFENIEILLVCHGRAHNDTIVTVERKVKSVLDVNVLGNIT